MANTDINYGVPKPSNRPLESFRPFRFDLIDPKALLALANVMHEGSITHDEGSWRKLSVETHLGRAMGHVQWWLMGDRSIKHLWHALTRLMMAVAIDKETKLPNPDGEINCKDVIGLVKGEVIGGVVTVTCVVCCGSGIVHGGDCHNCGSTGKVPFRQAVSGVDKP